MTTASEAVGSPPSAEELRAAVDEVTQECGHYKERYGKCHKNWQKKSLMRGGDMRYACDEFYDDFRACVVEHLAARGVHDVPFFGVSSQSSMFKMDSTDKKNTKLLYTYWKRDIADGHVLPSCEPQLLSSSSAESTPADADPSMGRSTSTGYLASKWNAGTTYEEKDITERAKRVLSEILRSHRFLDQHVVEFVSPSLFSKGEVHAHIVRGKAKIGYDIELVELNINGLGTVKVMELDSTDPSGFSVKLIESSHAKLSHSEVKSYVSRLMNAMCTHLLE